MGEDCLQDMGDEEGLKTCQTAEQVQQKASFLWSFLHELWSSPHFSRASTASEGFFTSSANASWRACHEGMTYTPASSIRWVHQPARTVELSRHLGHAAEEQGGGGQQEGEQSLQLWPGGVC